MAAAEHTHRHNGRVPSTYDSLLALDGVGPKIAHLMRSVAYGEADAGIVVDTHVLRVATRLGWVDGPTAASGAEAVRQSLEAWVPYAERTAFSLAVVGFGQLARGGKGWGRGFVEHAAGLSGRCELSAQSSTPQAPSGDASDATSTCGGSASVVDSADCPSNAKALEPPCATALQAVATCPTGTALESVDLGTIAESMVIRMDDEQVKHSPQRTGTLQHE